MPGAGAIPPGAGIAEVLPPWMRASSCWLSWSVIWSPAVIICLCMAIWCIGFFAIGFVVVGVEVAGGEEGVIGAVWAQLGTAIARAAAMATPVKRCFMLFVLCGSSGFGTTLQRRALSPAGPC